MSWKNRLTLPKKYQGLDKVYEFNIKNDLKKLTDNYLKDNNFNSNKYQNHKDCKTYSFSSRFDYLKKFHDNF